MADKKGAYMIPNDKKLHFTAGSVISFIAFGACVCFIPPMWALVVGASMATLAGIIKELLDYRANRKAAAKHLPPPHGVEFLDFVATALGGIFSMGLIAVLCLLSGCLGRGTLPVVPEKPSILSGGSPSGVLLSLAVWAAWVGGIGLLACAVAAIWAPDKTKVLKAGIICLAILVGSEILQWLGKNLVLATALVVVCGILCGAAYVWIHRKALKKQFDLDDSESRCIPAVTLADEKKPC